LDSLSVFNDVSTHRKTLLLPNLLGPIIATEFPLLANEISCFNTVSLPNNSEGLVMIVFDEKVFAILIDQSC
jgi:hypothetical protein